MSCVMPKYSSAFSTLTLVLCLAFVVSPRTYATDRLFEDDALLEITVSGPFAKIDKERDKEAEYEGSLSYVDEDGQAVVLDTKFSVRGNFRLRKSVCSHAQLWVNLKKGQVKGTLFAKQNKLKLVMQCKDSDRYQDYLVREHQAYLMYQELSDYSLDTRFLRVTYVDSEEDEQRTQLGFFIQHQKRLAKDLDMQVVATPGAEKARLDSNQGALVAIYMYLLSNTDYSMISSAPGDNCCHNIKVLEAEDGVLYPIPYDFDSTGFVNAPYAEPSGGLGQRNVRQRMYRGYCLHRDSADDALEQIREKRDLLYAIISDDSYASAKGIKKANKYVDDFFKVIDTPKKLKRDVVDACR